MRVLAWPAYKTRQVNPYNWLLYSHLSNCGVSTNEFSPSRLLFGKYDVLHVHWPDNQLKNPNILQALPRIAGFIGLICCARMRGIKVVWTVHNLKSHEGNHPKIEKWFWKIFTNQIDGFFSLSYSEKEKTIEEFPKLSKKPGFVTPHGWANRTCSLILKIVSA